MSDDWEEAKRFWLDALRDAFPDVDDAILIAARDDNRDSELSPFYRLGMMHATVHRMLGQARNDKS